MLGVECPSACLCPTSCEQRDHNADGGQYETEHRRGQFQQRHWGLTRNRRTGVWRRRSGLRLISICWRDRRCLRWVGCAWSVLDCRIVFRCRGFVSLRAKVLLRLIRCRGARHGQAQQQYANTGSRHIFPDSDSCTGTKGSGSGHPSIRATTFSSRSSITVNSSSASTGVLPKLDGDCFRT